MSDALPDTPFNLARYCLDQGADAAKPALLVAEGPRGRIVETWTYGEMRAAVARMAGGFGAFGLPRGSRVLLRVGNTSHFPLLFFGAIAALCLAASLVLMAPVLAEYFATGLVPRLPTWVLSMALMMMAMLFGVCGLILDSVARGRAEQMRMVYLSYAPARAEPLRLPSAKARPAAAKARVA